MKAARASETGRSWLPVFNLSVISEGYGPHRPGEGGAGRRVTGPEAGGRSGSRWQVAGPGAGAGRTVAGAAVRAGPGQPPEGTW
ncbi:hypothetical protein GCM10014719_22000 [Planomonospora parontospora subsp. antibiotica]|nr:hypothetical protein GCM10014719_22000 [Planomonospora parontospora subsp. antibiotica]GII13726.1 hypothetical protein Ppa05_04520 [Planomonospora parontospora subsp. antibiotica]